MEDAPWVQRRAGWNRTSGVWNENPELPYHLERDLLSKSAQVRNNSLKSRTSYFPQQKEEDHDISILPRELHAGVNP